MSQRWEAQLDIELIYFSKDPRQVELRDFVKEFVARSGILASITETDQPVKSPTVTVNGQSLCDLRKNPRRSGSRMFPSLEDIARVLEKHSWCL